MSASPLNISTTLIQRFHPLGNIKSLFFDLLIPYIKSFKTSNLSIQIYGGCNAYFALQACTNVGCSDINLVIFYQSTTLRKECPYLSYSGQYLVWMRENTDQNNSYYGHFSRSAKQPFLVPFKEIEVKYKKWILNRFIRIFKQRWRRNYNLNVLLKNWWRTV